VIAALMRPRFLSCKNRWRVASSPLRSIRDFTIAGFSIAAMWGMYRATLWGLEQTTQLPFLVYIPPSLILELLLVLLLPMTLLSALGQAIGHVYLADDLDLILASPASAHEVFFARFGTVSLSVSWMPFIFIMPVIIALQTTYGGTPWFYLWSILGLLPYFLIPCALATLLATFLVAAIDPRWTRVLVVCGIACALVSLSHAANAISELFLSRSDPNQILRLVQTMSAASSDWLPSTWLAGFMSDLLVPTGKSFSLRLALLYSTAVCCIALACGATTMLHGYAYTKSRSSASAHGRRSSQASRKRAWLVQGTPSGAIILKEFRVIFRDLAQSSQLLFLAGLCTLYLGNIRLFVALDSFPAGIRQNWKAVFLIMHVAISAFFTISICTRLVFSSLSLEGKHFWILQTSPLPMSHLLRCKLIGWFVPIALLSAIVFASGVFLILEQVDLTVLYTALSLFISYGVVGTGIGLGAYFADFSWEHPTQLAMSIGSFVYMLICAALVMINLIPLTIILRIAPSTSTIHGITNLAWTGLMVALTALANTSIAELSLRLGERRLRES
jgi:ABC-2 type transport system permease protein